MRHIYSSALAAALACLRSPSDLGAGSTTTETDLQKTTAEVEKVANVVGDIAAAEGGVIGQEANAALQGAETVTSTVEQSLADHNTALQTAHVALSAAIAHAPTVAAAVSPEAGAAVTAAATKATGLLAEIESVLAIFGIKL